MLLLMMILTIMRMKVMMLVKMNVIQLLSTTMLLMAGQWSP